LKVFHGCPPSPPVYLNILQHCCNKIYSTVPLQNKAAFIVMKIILLAHSRAAGHTVYFQLFTDYRMNRSVLSASQSDGVLWYYSKCRR
jgi:hypothetical protein